MNAKYLAVTGLALLALLGTGCNKLKSRDELNKGTAAFKASKFPEAIEHFKTAINLEPTYTMARLYLATAYMSQYIPGADSQENKQNAQAANDQFLKVLEQDPNGSLATLAVNDLASLHYSESQGAQGLEAKLEKLAEAEKWYTKLVEMDPTNKEAYYSLAVIIWAKWYPKLTEARAKLGMKPEDPGPIKDKKIKEELKTTYGPMIEDGIKKLQKSLDIDPQYDDAMAYMNLLIRERADLEDTADQYKKDVDTADSWVQKALETKKIKAEKAAQKANGITAN